MDSGVDVGAVAVGLVLLPILVVGVLARFVTSVRGGTSRAPRHRQQEARERIAIRRLADDVPLDTPPPAWPRDPDPALCLEDER